MGRFVAQLSMLYAGFGAAILLGRGARTIWTFPDGSILPLAIGVGILVLVTEPFRGRLRALSRSDYLDQKPLVAGLILAVMTAVFFFLLGLGDPLARNVAESVGAGAAVGGVNAAILGAGRLIKRRLARRRGIPVDGFRYRPGRIAWPLIVVAGAFLVLFFAIAIVVEIVDVVELNTE